MTLQRGWAGHHTLQHARPLQHGRLELALTVQVKVIDVDSQAVHKHEVGACRKVLVCPRHLVLKGPVHLQAVCRNA